MICLFNRQCVYHSTCKMFIDTASGEVVANTDYFVYYGIHEQVIPDGANATERDAIEAANLRKHTQAFYDQYMAYYRRIWTSAPALAGAGPEPFMNPAGGKFFSMFDGVLFEPHLMKEVHLLFYVRGVHSSEAEQVPRRLRCSWTHARPC